MNIYILLDGLVCSIVACSRRSDSGARAKNKASERAGKKRGETERLEQASSIVGYFYESRRILASP